jgi:hypothetical protein
MPEIFVLAAKKKAEKLLNIQHKNLKMLLIQLFFR